MTKMKKLVSLVLAALMLVGMMSVASAATVTIEGTGADGLLDGHTFAAFKIFDGKESTSTAGTVLVDITWGSDVNSAALLTALKADTTYGGLFANINAPTEGEADKTAADVADVLANNNTNVALAQWFAKTALANRTGNGTVVTDGTQLEAGYYLIVDTTATENLDKASNAALVEVTTDGDIKISVKTSKPTLNKQIKHNDDGNWGVVGDNQIGDTVEFRTITTVPDVTYFATYDYIIYDTMSVGLTSNVKTVSDVTIKVNDSDTAILDSKYYTVTVDENDLNKFTVDIDVKAAITDGEMKADDELYTYYSGVLNDEAVIYETGKQDNAAYLVYSNQPDDSSKTGKTPEKKVYDWTFKMDISKVDGNTQGALTGAQFVLTDVASQTPVLEGETLTGNENLIQFVKNGTTYRVATAEQIADDDVTKTYIIEAGTPIIEGLDDATTYYLHEIKAPDGYNLLTEPVEFVINAIYSEDGSSYSAVTLEVGTEEPTQDMTATIENNSGATLPETGGIGTTIFYAVGGLLVVLAVVLLVTKRRVGEEN